MIERITNSDPLHADSGVAQPRIWLDFRLKRLLYPLRQTPLHPQWLVYLGETSVKQATATQVQGRVLDIGCGDGWLADALTEEVDYVGFDYPVTVDKGYRGHASVLGSADALPFVEGAFDTVAMLDVLEHLAHPSVAVGEAHRVLRPGGRLIVHVPFMYPLHDVPHDFQRWTRMGLELLVESSGFEIRECGPTGEPLATAAAMQSIGLARAVLDVMVRKTWSILLLPLLVLGIPVTNLIGWALSRLLPDNDFMPLGYRIVAEKPA